jgi:hypothetical protein
MLGSDAASRWPFVAGWAGVCACATSLLVGSAACLLSYQVLPPLVLYLLYGGLWLAPGLVLGGAQWPLLRPYVRGARWWILATGLGYLLGLVSFGLIATWFGNSLLWQLFWPAGIPAWVWFGALGVLTSSGIAWLQIPVLHSWGLRGLPWWVVAASAGGLLLGPVIVFAIGSGLLAYEGPIPLWAGCSWPLRQGLPTALFAPGSGAVYGLITGLLLGRVLPARCAE